jgi:UDP-N-acetylmuramate--alanine ligase
MSAIARLLLERGAVVSGSDCTLSPLAQKLRQDGVQIFVGHRAEQVSGAELVVRSSAIPLDNVEVLAAQAAGIPVLNRSVYLGELMADQVGIAVAGTHGKTTTTAMIAWLLTALNQDPTFIVGGILNNLETNAHAGEGAAFVIEADEYDNMFLGLSPTYAVVTNVEYDHPDFFPTPDVLFQSFREFVRRLTPDGVLLACTDDAGAAQIAREAAEAGFRTFTYGLNGTPTYHARNLRLATGGGTIFDLVRGENLFVKVALPVSGEHNVLNAVAALGVMDLLGLSVPEAAQALRDFRGTGRRFQIRGVAAGVTVIDDYAHHPTEIRATLQAARQQYPDQEIWAVWQPHTFLRTQAFFEPFTRAFGDADHVVVTEVFAAREQIPPDFSSRQLVHAMDHPDAAFVPDLGSAVNYLRQHVGAGSVVLVLSAGDADQISTQFVESLERIASEDRIDLGRS